MKPTFPVQESPEPQETPDPGCKMEEAASVMLRDPVQSVLQKDGCGRVRLCLRAVFALAVVQGGSHDAARSGMRAEAARTVKTLPHPHHEMKRACCSCDCLALRRKKLSEKGW